MRRRVQSARERLRQTRPRGRTPDARRRRCARGPEISRQRCHVGQAVKRVGPQQQQDRPAGIFRTQLLERQHGVALARARELARVDDESRETPVPRDRSIARRSAADAAGPARCGGSPAGTSRTSGSCSARAHLVGQAQMAVVHRVERATQQGKRCGDSQWTPRRGARGRGGGCPLRVASWNDHVGAQQDRCRQHEAERPGCPEIDHELELGGLLDR